MREGMRDDISAFKRISNYKNKRILRIYRYTKSVCLDLRQS